jgi:hypothetical protein
MMWSTQWIWLGGGMALMALASMAWRRLQANGDAPTATGWYWDVVYIEDNGEMLMSTLHVLGVNSQTRRLMAWCNSSGRERQFRLSRIASAMDLQSGRRVNLSRWMAKASGKSGTRSGRRRLTGQPAF